MFAHKLGKRGGTESGEVDEAGDEESGRAMNHVLSPWKKHWHEEKRNRWVVERCLREGEATRPKMKEGCRWQLVARGAGAWRKEEEETLKRKRRGREAKVVRDLWAGEICPGDLIDIRDRPRRRALQHKLYTSAR